MRQQAHAPKDDLQHRMLQGHEDQYVPRKCRTSSTLHSLRGLRNDMVQRRVHTSAGCLLSFLAMPCTTALSIRRGMFPLLFSDRAASSGDPSGLYAVTTMSCTVGTSRRASGKECLYTYGE